MLNYQCQNIENLISSHTSSWYFKASVKIQKNILYIERFLRQFHISFFRYTTMSCVLLYVLLAYLCAYSSLAPCYNYVKFIALLVFILLLLLWCSVLCACMCFAFRYIICPICTNGTILVISQHNCLFYMWENGSVRCRKTQRFVE